MARDLSVNIDGVYMTNEVVRRDLDLLYEKGRDYVYTVVMGRAGECEHWKNLNNISTYLRYLENQSSGFLKRAVKRVAGRVGNIVLSPVVSLLNYLGAEP